MMYQVPSVNNNGTNIDIEVRGGDIGGECPDQESTFLISTNPQTPNPTNKESVNQLASKARDSREK
jgi:hypothetical protein